MVGKTHQERLEDEYYSTEIFVNFYIVQNDSIWECNFYQEL